MVVKPLTGRRLAAAAAFWLLLVGFTSACGSGQAGGPPAVAVMPSGSDPAALVLPVEKYLFTPSQDSEVQYAAYQGARQCVARFGLSIPAEPRLSGQYSGGLVPLRYGPTDSKTAAQYGYHRTDDSATQTSNANASASGLTLSSLSAPVYLVFMGVARAGSSEAALVAANHLGSIPAGGCRAQGSQALGGGADPGESPVAEQIKNQGFTASMADPRVVTAIGAWSACMKSKGDDYKNPIDAYSDPRWGTPSAGPAEISTAENDVTCKQQTNLVGIWYAVESAYETQQIRQNQSVLATELTAKNTELSRAAAYASDTSNG